MKVQKINLEIIAQKFFFFLELTFVKSNLMDPW